MSFFFSCENQKNPLPVRSNITPGNPFLPGINDGCKLIMIINWILMLLCQLFHSPYTCAFDLVRLVYITVPWCHSYYQS